MRILSPVDKLTPSTVCPFAKALERVPAAVVATFTESLISRPVLTASTYSFVAREVAVNPDLSL